MPVDDPWERLESTTVYAGYTTVRRDTYRLADGTISDWDVIPQPRTVTVVAFTTAGDVLLFDQYRVGPARVLGEVPGGMIEDGESPTAAAVRELAEETGYRAGAVFDAGAEWVGANSTRRASTVIAVDCVRADEPRWEAGEMGRVRVVAASDFIDHLLSGELSDAGKALRGLHVFARAEGLSGPLSSAQHAVRALLAP